MTAHVCLVLLVYLVSAATALAQSPSWADVVAPLERSVLLLNDGGCSGIVLNAAEGYVLTAAHCVGKDTLVDGREAKSERISARLDLAVLKVKKLPRRAANIQLAPAAPRAGTDVAAVGYPFGARSLTVQTGVVANANVDGRAWINADLLHGDSGGAIVDAQGRLVAVTSGYLAKPPAAHIGLAIPLETVRDFVDDFLPPR